MHTQPAILSAGLLALSLVTSTALAQEQCGSWSAAMQEDEGGPQMTASVCSTKGGNPGHILLVCGQPGDVGFRYLPGHVAQAPTDVPNFKGAFHLTSEGGTVNTMLSYEEMDGAYTTYVKTGHDLITVLKSGKEVTMTGPFKPESFSLTGSSKAIDTLIKACKG
ncbi:hypothetical protein [Pararhizobium sp.]|uniref:hypothetical protein n=1 Tax=Pararhizobium sp. TaxID=1977563 RepID=UPI00272354B1|nr:hypothetical protein [Pararhizobium sp.]MDO9418997.1 hypothetical protein [Pararhizobium sp.]